MPVCRLSGRAGEILCWALAFLAISLCGYLFLIRSPGNFLIFCMGLSVAVSPVVVSSCIGPCRVWGLVGLAGSRCWGLVLRLARSRFRVGGPLGFPGQVPFFQISAFFVSGFIFLWVAFWVLESCFPLLFFSLSAIWPSWAFGGVTKQTVF